MFYNHLHKLIEEHTEGLSLCPDCMGMLIVKQCNPKYKRSHWAHKRTTPGCLFCEETEWHTENKFRYLKWDNWVVEYPISINGRKFRLDTCNPITNKVREFVHTLSNNYIDKHLFLKHNSDLDIVWIFDGVKLGSKAQKKIRDNGIKNLLKPKAYDIAVELDNVWVDIERVWYKEWTKKGRINIWYPISNNNTIIKGEKLCLN